MEFNVEPFFVTQGIGTLLVEYLIQQVRKKGMHKIILWVIKDNMKAGKFYEQMDLSIVEKYAQ